jgi:hypothetical protein
VGQERAAAAEALHEEDRRGLPGSAHNSTSANLIFLLVPRGSATVSVRPISGRIFSDQR